MNFHWPFTTQEYFLRKMWANMIPPPTEMAGSRILHRREVIRFEILDEKKMMSEANAVGPCCGRQDTFPLYLSAHLSITSPEIHRYVLVSSSSNDINL